LNKLTKLSASYVCNLHAPIYGWAFQICIIPCRTFCGGTLCSFPSMDPRLLMGAFWLLNYNGFGIGWFLRMFGGSNVSMASEVLWLGSSQTCLQPRIALIFVVPFCSPINTSQGSLELIISHAPLFFQHGQLVLLCQHLIIWKVPSDYSFINTYPSFFLYDAFSCVQPHNLESAF
jgi:hypothetical protein